MNFVHYTRKKNVEVANPPPTKNSKAFLIPHIFGIIYNILEILMDQNCLVLYFQKSHGFFTLCLLVRRNDRSSE